MRKSVTGLFAFAVSAMFGSVPACGSAAADSPHDLSDGGPDALVPAEDSSPLFVDGEAGDDDNDGSRAKPLKTIGAAVAKAPTAGKRQIHVCGSGTYPEHLNLTNAVSIYGGFACASWAADDGAFPKVAPGDKGYALHVDHVRGAVTISNLELAAADLGDLKDGASSIAVFVNEANVTFLNTTLSASDGAAGASGKEGGTGVNTPSDLKGNSASGANGGASKVCTCSSSMTATKGGTGGSNTGGGVGEPIYGTSGLDNGAAGAPGAGDCLTNGGHGHNGADAPPARSAEPIETLGVLDAEGWHPTAGADGPENGEPGQGGGGGGAFNSGQGGAGGGCGGCGGFAGKGGGGGGASIALLVNNSLVTLTNGSLFTRKGGTGGNGGAGGTGAGGGIAGSGSCGGGSGGRGADGGAGGGGAGGVSIGILYTGTAPQPDEKTTIQPGAAGPRGKGGKSPENDGPTSVPEKMKDAALL